MKQYLECARVVGTHGVRGMMKLASLADSPEALAKVKKYYTENKDGSWREWDVKGGFIHKGLLVASVGGIEDLDTAITMKGTVFFADRKSFKLKKGDYFIADVIGLPVIDESTGSAIGTLSEVLTERIQHLYVVKTDAGDEFMIPGVPEFIKKVVPKGDGAGIYVHLIDGMVPETGGKDEN